MANLKGRINRLEGALADLLPGDGAGGSGNRDVDATKRQCELLLKVEDNTQEQRDQLLATIWQIENGVYQLPPPLPVNDNDARAKAVTERLCAALDAESQPPVEPNIPLTALEEMRKRYPVPLP